MTELMMINVTGVDVPGITAEIATVLQRYQAEVLDLNQASFHGAMAWACVVKVPGTTVLVEALQDQLCGQNLTVRGQILKADEYRAWVEGGGATRHVVTFIAPKLGPDALQAVSQLLADEALSIERIERLSGRRLEQHSDRVCCYELQVVGQVVDAKALRQRLLALSEQFEIDIAVQRDTVFRRQRRLVVFDMDSTLIEAEVIDELAKAAGIGEQVAAITESAMRGEIDFSESFCRRMALLKGLDEQVLADIAAALPLTPGAECLLKTLKRLGYKTAILSGGFTYFARLVAKRLGIDEVYANELLVEEGKVTGAVCEPVLDGARKAQLLRMLAEREGISLEQTIAVGDGANDLPMLSIAGLGVAFRAKPLVQASANHSISVLGLDAILYLFGFRDQDMMQLEALT